MYKNTSLLKSAIKRHVAMCFLGYRTPIYGEARLVQASALLMTISVERPARLGATPLVRPVDVQLRQRTLSGREHGHVHKKARTHTKVYNLYIYIYCKV